MRGFSARQIVTVVVAVCATVVLTPTAIWAASSSLVRISDGSGKVAQVDPTGHLYVTDGKGPLTVDGGVKVTNGSSSLKVSGTVDARVATPAHPWNTVNGVNLSAGTPSAVLYSGIAGTRLNITSFTYASDGSTPGTISLNLQVYVSDSAAGDCTTLTGATFGAAERFEVTEQVGNTTNLVYPSPLVYTQYGSTGSRYCVKVSATGPSGFGLHIGASGFLS